jgi:DNA-binding LytR/AlgR family response regulator
LAVVHQNAAAIERIIAEVPRFEVIEKLDTSEAHAHSHPRSADVLIVGAPVHAATKPGLRVANEPSYAPLTILVSPTDMPAAALFESGLFDFILESALPDRMRQALSRADQWLARMAITRALRGTTESRRQAVNAVNDGDRTVALVTPRRVLLFRALEIDWAEATGGRVTVCANSRQYPVQETLAQFATRLPDSLFIRVRRSTIVNRRCIQSVASRGHGELRLSLKGGRQIDVGITYRDAIERLVARPTCVPRTRGA